MFANHCICATCFGRNRPGVTPVRLRDPEQETCCFCGMATDEGIYIRAASGEVPHCACKREKEYGGP